MKLRSHYFWLGIIALAIGFCSTAAHADVVYSFTGTNDDLGGDGLPVGFQFTTSSFITAPPLGTTVSTSQLTNCTNCALNSPIAAVFLPSAIIGSALVFPMSITQPVSTCLPTVPLAPRKHIIQVDYSAPAH